MVPKATAMDTAIGAAELAEAGALPQMPAVVLTRIPGGWGVTLPDPPSTGSGRTTTPGTRGYAARPLIVAVDAGHEMPG